MTNAGVDVGSDPGVSPCLGGWDEGADGGGTFGGGGGGIVGGGSGGGGSVAGWAGDGGGELVPFTVEAVIVNVP